MENYQSHKHFLPLLCFFLLLLLSGQQGVEASDHDHNVKVDGDDHDLVYSFYPTKLFVFGDSYSDTGNTNKSKSYKCWKYPYGVTFPGKPTGRFSDGRVFTDYLAKFVGVKPPLPYQRWRKGGKLLKYGMNFAYGGTGVFETSRGGPNLTTQIDLFQKLIKQSMFTATDLHSALALITITGNDYSTFQAKNNGSSQDYLSFVSAMLKQTSLNLKSIRGLGVKKIAVTNFPPLGCLPPFTAKTTFQHCNENLNVLVNLHNALLRQGVAKLNSEAVGSPFLILDLYASFMSIFEKKGHPLGGIKFENLLKPCCVGTSSEYSCGSVDQSDVKKYTICDPKSAFFWDNHHLTQQGWKAVYSALQPTLYKNFELNGVYSSS